MNDLAKGVCVVAIVLASIGAILFVVLLAASFAVLDPNEMGILYNVATKHLDRTQLYTSGRHYVGVGNRFIKYPKTVETLTISSIDARTADGLSIEMELSFNYKITADIVSVLSIYENFGDNYTVVQTKVASNVVRDVAATFEAFSFFINRSTVTLDMGSQLAEGIKDYGFDIDSFQLLNLNFPTQFSEAIVETQVAQQQIEQVQYDQLAALVEANTSIAEANRTADMKILTAEAQAAAIIAEKKADAAALETALGQEATAYRLLIDELGFTTDQFVTWVWLSAIDGTEAAQSIVVSRPEVLKTY